MRGQTNASNVGGTVGDDTHPVKSVNGVLTPVANALIENVTSAENTIYISDTVGSGYISYVKCGKIVQCTYQITVAASYTSTWANHTFFGSGLPIAKMGTFCPINFDSHVLASGWLFIGTVGDLSLSVRGDALANAVLRGSVTYLEA